MYIGTCSWKYDSWRGIVYSDQVKPDYLAEYAQKFNSVEVDQWFWSLFGVEKVKLPDLKTVRSYADSVDSSFRFSIKVPNSITLTHLYKHTTGGDLLANPHFLSADLFGRFLDTLEVIHPNIGILLFQFEYLNKQKMASASEFVEKLRQFFDTVRERTAARFPMAIEIRNPNYLKRPYFEFLKQQRVSHVFVQGYYMPDIVQVYDDYSDYIDDTIVIRLLGPDRKGIEKETGKKWDRIVVPRDEEIERIIRILLELEEKGITVYLNINNHYEGSAPKTIDKFRALLRKG